AVGALVFWKRPEDRAAAQFFLLCIVTAGAYMGGYHWARISTQPALILTFMVCAVLLPALRLHFYLLFPRPQELVVRWPHRTLLAIYGPPSLFLVALAFSYAQLRGVVRAGFTEEVLARGGALPEEALAGAWSVLRSLVAVYIWLAALWYLASVTCLAHSYRSARGLAERNQVKWIL